MAITIRDTRSGARLPAKRSVASLVGGVVIALGCFVLWVLVASQLAHGTPSIPVIAAGAAVALGIGVWIRVADL
jgi:hypothetical protein